MHRQQIGFLFLAATGLGLACVGCAPAPYCSDPVIVVVVPGPDPYPPPPVIVVSSPAPPTRPLERHQVDPVTATKIREVVSSPVRGTPRVEPVRDERAQTGATTSGRDAKTAVGDRKTRTR